MCVPVLASVLIKVELRIGDLFAAAKLLPAMGGGSTWGPRTDLCALMVMAEEQGSRTLAERCRRDLAGARTPGERSPS